MRQHTSSALLTVIVSCGMFPSAPAPGAELSAEQTEVFERQIRPLLVEHCLECHGPDKQQAELRLDTGENALRGNESGPAIVPGKPEESRLVQVIRYADDDVQMPPDGKLDDAQIHLLTQWIADGAFWPASASGETAGHDAVPLHADGSIDFERAASEHWAYRPVETPAVPDVDGECRTPIDRFVASRLEQAGLSLSPEADRGTLIRRATVDLLGIPPTYEEVEAFVADESPDAYERMVDRLLASPEYGERWARHWLDVARYADTKGYVFTENRFYPFSYTYRDYVIGAFNNDKPYDRFVMEQIAADQLGFDASDPALAALGFLTVGPRFRNDEHDIIDDRLDVTFRGLMGMTIGCARCHDHKYDPIPTADYYSLYGVFASSYEPEALPVIGGINDTPAYRAYRTELEKRRRAVEDYKRQSYDELLNQARSRAGDYLLAVLRSEDGVPGGVAADYEHGAPRDKLIRLWRDMLQRHENVEDPVFGPWQFFRQVPAEAFQEQVTAWLADPAAQTPHANPLLIASLGESPPETMVDVARVYGALLSGIQERWVQMQSESGDTAPDAFPDPREEQLRRVLYGAGSVTEVPFESAERQVFERDNRDRIRELERNVSEWEVTSDGAPPRAMVMRDRDRPEEPVVFVRGSSDRRGDRVPRRFPQVLSAVSNGRFRDGSGRRELAAAIASRENPLTARVIVNRVWSHHFGAGLVATPSDFGSRSSPPTHPELLDYLAATFMERGWSLKDLHRRIMLSAVYRQASLDRPDCRAADPENSLLWRANRRRLEFEAMRDGMLFVAGRLDTTMGGRPVDIESRRRFTGRRSVYGLIDRNNFSGLLRTFDLPTPDSSAPERPNTTVPQQALFALNSRFVQQMSSAVAERVRGGSRDPVREAFRTVLARDPLPDEHRLLTEYLDQRPESLAELVQSLLMTNEFMFVD